MIGLLLFSHLDLPTLLVASIAPDIEPAIAVALNLSYSGYGWFHTIPGSIVAVLVVAVVMYGLRNYTCRLLCVFRLHQESSFKKVFPASFIGVYSHILLDAPLHAMTTRECPGSRRRLLG